MLAVQNTFLYMCPHSKSNVGDAIDTGGGDVGNLAPTAEQQFSDFVSTASFPCVGAKSALNKSRMRFGQFGSLGDPAESPKLAEQLKAFSAEFPDPGNVPTSFVALFGAAQLDEVAFERVLWRQLQSLHDHDVRLSDWNESVGSDPDSNDFSMSIGGRAYFVVGLHPGASRLARRAPFPCLVFNFHDQFVSLKATGKYETMQMAIRARDTALQGSVNPVLARFGDASEARQYSGRAVPDDWKCPFHAQEVQHA